VNVSLNEAVTLSYRAALGAGLGFGLAEDAAQVAAQLAMTGADVATTMAKALACAESCGAVSMSCCKDGDEVHLMSENPLPALRAGPTIADLLQAGSATAVTVTLADDAAVVLAAIAAAALDQAVGCEALTAPGHFRFAKRLEAGPGRVPPRTQIAVADESWRDLLRLAARTYVPASEQSRLRGAGAGLSDSD
jgi:hypothetical protein